MAFKCKFLSCGWETVLLRARSEAASFGSENANDLYFIDQFCSSKPNETGKIRIKIGRILLKGHKFKFQQKEAFSSFSLAEASSSEVRANFTGDEIPVSVHP